MIKTGNILWLAPCGNRSSTMLVLCHSVSVITVIVSVCLFVCLSFYLFLGMNLVQQLLHSRSYHKQIYISY